MPIRLLVAMLVIGAAGLLAVMRSSAAEPPDANPPNIVLIMTDDQHWESIEYMPVLQERIVAQGVTFSNAFVTSPNCCPARAGFLTGDYVADHGVFTNGLPQGGADAFQPSGTVTEGLTDAGYHTAISGKFLTNYDYETNGDPTGFEEFFVYDDQPIEPPASDRDSFKYFNWVASDNGTEVAYGDSPTEYSTDVFGQRTADFISEMSGQAPFFAQYAPFAPHRPAALPERHRHLANAYLRDDFPPNYGVLPQGQAWTNELAESQWERTRQSEVEALRSQQIASLQSVDDNIELLLSTLERTGELDNTVVLFTSDNGFAWGEHRWLHKLCPYEACLRVPLVIADFRSSSSNEVRGTIDDRLVTNLDVAATIADLAGLEASSFSPNASPIVLGDRKPVRTEFLIENYGAGNGAQPLGMPAFQGVRTEAFKYIRYPDGAEELFILADDPFELVNVLDTATSGETTARQSTLTELDRLRRVTATEFPHGIKRKTVSLAVSDGCFGDGTPLEFTFDQQLPNLEEILALQFRFRTTERLEPATRTTLDVVAADAGWPQDRKIALPARVVAEDSFVLPINQQWLQQVESAQLKDIQITTDSDPDRQICLRDEITLEFDYLATGLNQELAEIESGASLRRTD